MTPRGASGLNVQVALSSGHGFGSFGLWANTGSNYTIGESRFLVGDFTGNGKTDVAIVTPRGASGLNIQVALSNGHSFGPWQLWANTGTNYTIDQTQVVAGDFTGNGRTDIALVTPRGASGLNYQVALSTGHGFAPWQLWANTGTNYTIDQSQVVAGDFTGNGKADLAIVTPRGATGLNYQVALSTGHSFAPWQLWANTGSNYTIDRTQIGIGDFGGNRKDDLLIVTPRGASGLNYQVALSTGHNFSSWQLWANTGSNYKIEQTQLFGGDFNGGPRDGIGIVTLRGATGLNYQVALSTGSHFGSWQLWANTGGNYTLDQEDVVG